ncbi:MAG: MBL fold metallo-hydrolase [Flavobacteriales bacterium]|nr:MBL fold metallo-hydrolase [Flavobacteriales bacterium]
MRIEQLYTGCLSEAAYYIESEGEVAIIDPLRETEPYLLMAAENNAKIKYIFETHFHADFVSGHVDLAKKTGATIVFGPTAQTGFDSYTATDNEEFKIGKLTIKVLHTPGHTLESSTYLLLDEKGKEHAIFSGDTLFIGDVGRPDLAVKSDLTEKDLAAMLYDSLRNKIMTLPNDVIVYPAHGAGSACGKNMSKETFDTLGHQKEVNYALQNMTKEAFIKEVTEGILPAPQYFPKNAMINKSGSGSIDEVMEKGTTPLSLSEFKQQIEGGALVLDTRAPQTFTKGFVPNSLYIGIDGGFAVWLGTLVHDLNRPIVLVADAGREEEIVLRCSRVGYDNVVGFLKGGFETWKSAGEKVEFIESVSAETFASRIAERTILDVRKPGEFEAEHVEKAQTFPLDYINSKLDTLDKNKEYFVHCAGGYRSMIASSIMKANGINNVIDVAGGMGAILKTNATVTAYVCPSTL